jgi:UPF0176 protein
MAKNLHNRVNREVLIERIKNDSTPRTTISFYKYAKIGNTSVFRDHIYILLYNIGVLGRIYVAHEGVNAQISVPAANEHLLREKLNEITFLENCRLNKAREESDLSFFKLTIKVREKIVADGLNDTTFDVTNKGLHLNAADFNAMLEKDNTIVVDLRNHYETEVGHFVNALMPDVETFREELPYVENLLETQKDKNLLMYCTGGIRCEKASAYFKHRGFKNVYQLEGGIIEYARQVEEQKLENKFLGKNFVFDERLGERIGSEIIAKCHQCGDSCDDHTNCANEACHILFIQCNKCKAQYKSCCSAKCADYNTLSPEQKQALKGKVEFNGTKFGKGRYKALHKDERLELK